MKKRSILGAVTFLLSLGLSALGLAIEKLGFATAVKDHPLYVLPILAAEDNGFWKEQGLEVKWFPIGGGGPMYRAIAAGSVFMGLGGGATAVQAVAAGVPAVIVADMQANEPFHIWLHRDSPLQEPKDLKGAKIGVSSFGGVTHAYGRIAAKALGLERDIKFVALGGSTNVVAALRARSVEAALQSIYQFATLKFKGEVRELVSIDNFLPKEWVVTVIVARRDFTKGSPQVVRGVVKTLLRSADFIMTNPGWSIEKMKSIAGLPEEAGKYIHANVLRYGRQGTINRRGLENLTSMLIEYGIIAKEKARPVDELYTTDFLP